MRCLPHQLVLSVTYITRLQFEEVVVHNAWAQRHAGSALAPRGGVVGDVVEVDPAAVVDRVLEPLGQYLWTGLGIGLELGLGLVGLGLGLEFGLELYRVRVRVSVSVSVSDRVSVSVSASDSFRVGVSVSVTVRVRVRVRAPRRWCIAAGAGRRSRWTRWAAACPGRPPGGRGPR